MGGGPVPHARLTKLERLAGPSAPRSVTPHPAFDLTPRTLQRVERRGSTRPPRRTRLTPSSGAALLLETGADFLLGPSGSGSEKREASLGVPRSASAIRRHRIVRS